MRFLIYHALPPRLADLLVAADQDAVHVRAYAMHGARDEEILARAFAEDRIVVSADSDFSAIRAAATRSAGAWNRNWPDASEHSPELLYKKPSKPIRCLAERCLTWACSDVAGQRIPGAVELEEGGHRQAGVGAAVF